MGCRSLRRGGVIAGAGEMQPPEDFCKPSAWAAGRFGEAETHGRSPWRRRLRRPPAGGPHPPTFSVTVRGGWGEYIIV